MGHTIVNEISSLYEGKILAIDVKHSVMLSNQKCNAIILKNGQWMKVDINGKKSSIDPLAMDSSSSVLQAIQKKNDAKLERFLLSGSDVNGYYTKRRLTLLHYAIEQDNPGAMRILLDRGADPNRRVEDKTALMYAIKKERLPLIKILLEAGVNVNEQNLRKKTALYYAAKYGNADISKMLVEKGARLNHRDYKGRSPLDYAEDNKNLPVAEYLRILGQKTNQ